MAENPPRELAGLWKRRLPRRQELGGLLETEEGWVPGQNGMGKPFTWTLGGRLQRMQVKRHLANLLAYCANREQQFPQEQQSPSHPGKLLVAPEAG